MFSHAIVTCICVGCDLSYVTFHLGLRCLQEKLLMGLGVSVLRRVNTHFSVHTPNLEIIIQSISD